MPILRVIAKEVDRYLYRLIEPDPVTHTGERRYNFTFRRVVDSQPVMGPFDEPGDETHTYRLLRQVEPAVVVEVVSRD